VALLKANWDGIISEIRSLRDRRPTIIRTMDIYNPYVAEDQAADTWPGDAGTDFQVLNPYLNEVNAYIVASSAANGILVAPVHTAFNGASGNEDPAAKGYLSFDGLHPSALGQKVIADLLRSLGYATTVP
jgi:lysophospholipase L1-like esterase